MWACAQNSGPMNLNDLRGSLGTLCQLAALALAIAASLKLFGLIALRPSVLEMAAVSIALAHVR